MSGHSDRVLSRDYEAPENKRRLYGDAVLLAREVEALEKRVAELEGALRFHMGQEHLGCRCVGCKALKDSKTFTECAYCDARFKSSTPPVGWAKCNVLESDGTRLHYHCCPKHIQLGYEMRPTTKLVRDDT